MLIGLSILKSPILKTWSSALEFVFLKTLLCQSLLADNPSSEKSTCCCALSVGPTTRWIISFSLSTFATKGAASLFQTLRAKVCCQVRGLSKFSNHARRGVLMEKKSTTHKEALSTPLHREVRTVRQSNVKSQRTKTLSAWHLGLDARTLLYHNINLISTLSPNESKNDSKM